MNADQKQVSWREKIAGGRKLALLLGMVWAADRALLASLLCLRIVQAVAAVAALWIWKLILDAAVGIVMHGSVDTGHLWRLVGLEFGVVASGDVLRRVCGLLNGILGERFTNRLSVQFIEHAKDLDYAYFEDPEFQDKVERARRQIGGRLAAVTSLLNIGQDVLSVALISAALVSFSAWLMLLLVVAVLPGFFGETHFATAAYSLFRNRAPERRYLDYLRGLVSNAQSLKEVQVSGLGTYLAEHYRLTSAGMEDESQRLATRRAIVGSVLAILSVGAYYGAFVAILFSLLSGGATVGAFTFLTRAFSRCRSHVEHIFSEFASLVEEAMFVGDLFDFLAAEPTIRSRPGARPVPRPIRQGLEFRNVGFTYPGSGRSALRRINFRMRPGEKLALIGENGAGKSTLVKLLTRLHDPTEGQILLDGVDLREYGLEELRRAIGMMFQDFVRYDMPVRRNIGFGDVAGLGDQRRLEAAAYKGLAKKLIERLPGQYDQMLGRRFQGGLALSRGEWQRLALARAHMPEAEILILDEPTASLDARAESEMFRRLAEHTRGRMALLISHRFSTTRMADRIVVLADGEIVEQGTHEELTGQGGKYATLFEVQARGYR